MANSSEDEAFMNAFQMEVLKHEAAELRIAEHWINLRVTGRCPVVKRLDESFQTIWVSFFERMSGGLIWPEDLKRQSDLPVQSFWKRTTSDSNGDWCVQEGNDTPIALNLLSGFEFMKNPSSFQNKKTGEFGYFYQTSERFVTGYEHRPDAGVIVVFQRRYHGFTVQPVNLRSLRLVKGAVK
jgi:hypothetical protein